MHLNTALRGGQSAKRKRLDTHGGDSLESCDTVSDLLQDPNQHLDNNLGSDKNGQEDVSDVVPEATVLESNTQSASVCVEPSHRQHGNDAYMSSPLQVGDVPACVDQGWLSRVQTVVMQEQAFVDSQV